MIQHRRTVLSVDFGIFSGYLFGFVSLALLATAAPLREGDTIPKIESYSIEGLPVSLHPNADRFLLIQVWKPEDAESINCNKETLLLYRRFHDKGLDALSIGCEVDEETYALIAQRWQIDWPQAMNQEETPSFVEQLGVEKIPCRFVVDSTGTVVFFIQHDEEAHEKIAQLFNVSLSDVPMPEQPTEKIQSDSRFDRSMLLSDPLVENGGSLLIAPMDLASSALLMGTPEERKQAEETIKIFRLINLALARYRLKNQGEMPDLLSDLYPDCLADEVPLICPTDPTGLSKYAHLGDPNVPTSFTYEFASVNVQGVNNQEQKKKLLEKYGDKVPVVRCFKFDRPLCLTYGGEIVFMDENWEKLLPTGKSLSAPDAQARQQLMTIGVAFHTYKNDKESIPTQLEELIPDYLGDSTSILNPVSNQPFTYLISPNREKYGDLAPIVQAVGIVEEGRILNLGYGGEIWESGPDWKEDLDKTSEIHQPTIIRVTMGNEERILNERNWPLEPLRSESPIDVPELMLPLRGEWHFQQDKKLLRMPNAQVAPTSVLLQPIIDQGEIRFRTRVTDGKEGIKVIFGYTSSNRYFVMNIGGWDNRYVAVRNWIDLDGSNVTTLSEQVPYSFPRNQWQDIRVTVDDATRTVECFINEKRVLRYTSEEPLTGRFGLGTWYTAAEFESIVISHSITPPPPDISSVQVLAHPPAKPSKQLESIGLVSKWDNTPPAGYQIYALGWKSLAYTAGIRSDDRIIAINGIPLSQAKSEEEAETILSQQHDSEWVITILRRNHDTPLEFKVQGVPQRPDIHSTPSSQRNAFDPIKRALQAAQSLGSRKPVHPEPPFTIPDEWSKRVFLGSMKVKELQEALPLRGQWKQVESSIVQQDINTAPTLLLFPPILNKGEIRLKANPKKGNEGIRIVFCFIEPNQPYLVWNIGGWQNSLSVVEQWRHLWKRPEQEVSSRTDFTLTHGVEHDIRMTINVDAGLVEGYIDGEKILYFQSPRIIQGRLGVGTWETHVEFQNIEIIGGIIRQQDLFLSNRDVQHATQTNPVVGILPATIPKDWPDEVFQGTMNVTQWDNVLPLRGDWKQKDSIFVQEDEDIAPSLLVFQPIVHKGEIRLKANAKMGSEGVRIVLGFTAPNQPYLVWNIGGWQNSVSVVEQWRHLWRRSEMEISPRTDFTLVQDKEHDIRMILDADTGRLEGYVDGQKILDFSSPSIVPGRLGVGTWGTIAEFQDITITGQVGEENPASEQDKQSRNHRKYY